MNPLIVIPTFVSKTSSLDTVSEKLLEKFDHMTALNRQGEFIRCLSSIKAQEIKTPILIIVVSEDGIEEEAFKKVLEESEQYLELNIKLISGGHVKSLQNRLTQMGLSEMTEGISLKSYGAIRNVAFVYAIINDFTEVIFIDDDEVIESPDFVENATYGLGMLTKNDIPILVKTGYYIDRKGSYLAKEKGEWYDRYWQQGHEFNQWIESAMSGTRLSQSNTACGGCLAVHQLAYIRVPFDPWIVRGEDMDYLFNIRMYGSDVWFDNLWEVKHMPPRERDEAARFGRDIYRWIYEYRKLEYSKTQIDLLQIQPKSLYPYPGTFLDSSINTKIFMTALLRTIGRSLKRKGYFRNVLSIRRQAREYAEANCANYFKFQHSWPEAMDMISKDAALHGLLSFETGVSATN